MDRRLKISIKFILIFIVVLLGTVPLILMHRVVTKTVKDNTLENTTLLTQGILNKSQKFLNLTLNQVDNLSKEIIENDLIIRELEKGYISEEIDNEIYRMVQESLVDSEILLLNLKLDSASTIYTPDNNKPLTINTIHFEEFLNSETVILLKENNKRVLWLSDPQNHDALDHTIWCYRIINLSSGSYILGTSINSDILRNFLGDIEKSTLSEVRLITTDNIIFPEDKNFFNYPFAAKSLSRSAKGRFINFTDMRVKDGEKEELLIHIYSDPRFYYNLVIITPQKSLLRVFNSVRRTTSWTLLLLTLFSIGFGIISIIFLQKRIRELIHSLDGISRGIYKIPLPKSKVVISEDLKLSRSISKMSLEVEETRKQLKERVIERTQELEKTRESLIHSEKMAAIGKSAAKLSHEVNNALGISITASTHLSSIIDEVADKIESNTLYKSKFLEFATESREVSDIIQNNLCRASELTLGFKSFASDQSTDDIKEIDLKSYINEIIKSYSYKLNNSPYNIELKSKERVIYRTYPAIIYQLITNLINNSILHGFENLDRGSITIELIEKEFYIKIIYKDDGKGISSENIKKLYDPFFTTKPDEGGTGLGLNIVRDLITNKLKGNINCTSKINDGVTFDIRLPKGDI